MVIGYISQFNTVFFKPQLHQTYNKVKRGVRVDTELEYVVNFEKKKV